MMKGNKWNPTETVLVRAFAYMVHYKQVSVHKAVSDMYGYWLLARTWESIRSQLNRQRKAILWESNPPLSPVQFILKQMEHFV